jgi:predicted dehydrogenase
MEQIQTPKLQNPISEPPSSASAVSDNITPEITPKSRKLRNRIRRRVRFERGKLPTIARKNNCEFFTDWRELLDKVDAVSIVTPTETHASIACAFLERGVHVLVEKPIARTLEEADSIIEAAEKVRREIDGRTSRTLNPAMVALRPLVTKPLYFEIHRVRRFRIGRWMLMSFWT